MSQPFPLHSGLRRIENREYFVNIRGDSERRSGRTYGDRIEVWLLGKILEMCQRDLLLEVIIVSIVSLLNHHFCSSPR